MGFYMKINDKILHMPPFISTTWDNITSLYSEANQLIIVLKNGSKIQIPNLPKEILDLIFKNHAKSLENSTFLNSKTSITFGLPPLPIAEGLDSFTTAMQHNPDQKDAPSLPSDVIKKIANLAKLFAEEANIDLPKPEANCNCMYCQIAKALQIGMGVHIENLDEEVSDADLMFRQWDIHEEKTDLYTVTNPLDQNEHYNVFLGNPIGCTCGKKNCEHIKAVLNS
jgi:hypothetical protein